MDFTNLMMMMMMIMITNVHSRLLEKNKNSMIPLNPNCKDFSDRRCEFEKNIALMELHLLTLVMGRSDVIEDYTGMDNKGSYDQAESWEYHEKNPMTDGVRFVKLGEGGEESMMGHFYFKRADMRTSSDSYEMGWQKYATHGFCQTFAACGFTGLGVPNFQDANHRPRGTTKMSVFVHNVKNALQVVRDYFVPRYFTEGVWKDATEQMADESSNVLVFPYTNLEPHEIQEDFDCILRQNDKFFETFIHDEYTHAVDTSSHGDKNCPDLI
jgi:hypothetical protein